MTSPHLLGALAIFVGGPVIALVILWVFVTIDNIRERRARKRRRPE